MSGEYHVPDPEFSGKNLRDMPAFLEVAQYGVASWTPQDNGQGKPEAVIMHFDMGGMFDGLTFGVRFMSALMSDVIAGRMDARTANAAVNAGGKLLKVVEMQYKYGSKAQDAPKPFRLIG